MRTGKKDGGGTMAVLVIIGLLVLVAKCGSPVTDTNSSASTAMQEVGNAQQALVTAVEAQTTTPIAALSARSVRKGVSRVVQAAKEGLAGEMIYSQNCYDALGRAFSWGKLDECGAFDVRAGLTMGEDTAIGSDAEVAWFDGEAAAGRYLKAAAAAGQETGEADRRLADLQSRVGKEPGAVVSKPANDVLDDPIFDGDNAVEPSSNETDATGMG